MFYSVVICIQFNFAVVFRENSENTSANRNKNFTHVKTHNHSVRIQKNDLSAGVNPNVTKLRKAGSRRNAGSSLFVTIFKIILDKYGKMCGLFANCG